VIGHIRVPKLSNGNAWDHEANALRSGMFADCMRKAWRSGSASCQGSVTCTRIYVNTSRNARRPAIQCQSTALDQIISSYRCQSQSHTNVININPIFTLTPHHSPTNKSHTPHDPSPSPH